MALGGEIAVQRCNGAYVIYLPYFKLNCILNFQKNIHINNEVFVLYNQLHTDALLFKLKA